jgi:uncharacterized protein YuzE
VTTTITCHFTIDNKSPCWVVCIDIQSCLWIRRGRDRMVVGFTITYAKQNVSVYQH